MPQTARPAQAPRQRCSGVSVTSHKRNEAGPTQKLTALELVKAMVQPPPDAQASGLQYQAR